MRLTVRRAGRGAEVDLSTESVETRVRSSATFGWLVRAGLIGYGLLHLLIAAATVRLTIPGLPPTPGQGALARLAQDPVGLSILILLGAGFAVLAVWQAIAGTVGQRHLTGRRRNLMRAGALCRAVTYGYLTVSVVRSLLHRNDPGAASQSPRTTSQGVLEHPLGRLVLGGAGVVVVGVGIGLVVFGIGRQFLEQLDDDARTGGRRVPIVILGQVGYVAKGIAFGVVGVLVFWAAVTNDPQQTGGLDPSLERLVGAPLGTVAVTVVGAGVGCFGLYLLARARHLRQRTLTS
jgi:hypothetical protein